MFSDKKESELADMAIKLNKNFWDQWCKFTDPFPDIEEASYSKLLVVEAALGIIFACYLKGFDRDIRPREKENMLLKLRRYAETEDLHKSDD